MGRERLFLGIDLGTSGIRIAALDEAGRRRGLLGRPWPHGQSLNPPVWLHLSLQLITLLRRRLRTADIAAIAIDGTSGSVLLCHPANGRPLTPVLAYNDGRATAEAERLSAAGLKAGPAFGPYGGPAKLLWLTRHDPPQAPAVLTAQGPWLAGMLAGHHGVLDEHNALKLGFDGAWCEALLQAPLAHHLGPVVAPGTPLGPLRRDWAWRLGLRTRPLIVAGTTDSTAAYLALGPLPAGCGVSSLGSTLVLKIASPRPISVPELGVYSHRLAETWLVGGASNSGAAVLAHYFDKAALVRLSAQLPVTADTRLDYYPLLAPGERFPINDPCLAPRLTPRPSDDRLFLQGLLEGLAAIEARGYALLTHHGAPSLTRVATTGGGAANGAWRAIRARSLGVPVSVIPDRPAAFGAARLARSAAMAHPP
ncbi:FGGY-family carbohydrate kinase [Acidiferrobacter sp.]|uniref:FGGY-family carbohydrate kinase n=1 Tax=Acidiferrobacter sp. TaxID=1872107 RepID=UPI002617CEA5|nr:FGGY-family carbohydrate kinase [Acidiferrobacter sp.]